MIRRRRESPATESTVYTQKIDPEPQQQHQSRLQPRPIVYATHRSKKKKDVRKPTGRTGMNHFEKYRKEYNKPPHLHPQEDIVHEMSQYWEWVKGNTLVKTRDTLEAYMTNVKMWHLYYHLIENTGERFPIWPAPKTDAELSKRLRDAESNFAEFDRFKNGEKRGTITPGMLEMIIPHIPGSKHMKNEITSVIIDTMLSGKRLGEAVADLKSAPARLLLKVGDVMVHKNQIDFNVLGKTIPPSRQFVYIKREQITHMVRKYGEHWDIFTSTRRRQRGRPANAPLYSDDNGKPLTYSNVYKALKIALEKAGLPKGAIGGHSGRIYMATLMAYQRKSVAEIMKRGRWNSDAWRLYVKLLIRHASDQGADPHTFRLGDIGISLHNFPKNHPEFTRA